MLLKDYVRLMQETGDVNAWEDGLHPDLDAIQVYNCRELICEAPALEDRSIMLSLRLLAYEYVIGNDLTKHQTAKDVIFKSADGASLWRISSERF